MLRNLYAHLLKIIIYFLGVFLFAIRLYKWCAPLQLLYFLIKSKTIYTDDAKQLHVLSCIIIYFPVKKIYYCLLQIGFLYFSLNPSFSLVILIKQIAFLYVCRARQKLDATKSFIKITATSMRKII